MLVIVCVFETTIKLIKSLFSVTRRGSARCVNTAKQPHFINLLLQLK